MLMHEIKRFMPALWAARAAVEFVGPPGIGKTSFIEDFCRVMSTKMPDKKFGYTEHVLSQMDSADIKGIPVLPQAGQVDADVFWSKPVLFPNPYNTRVFVDGEKQPLGTEVPERGLVLLDEYAQSGDSHQKASTSFVLEGRIGEFSLPPKWAVWMASNRRADKAGVAKRLTLVQNRLCEINVTPSFEAWVQWADGRVHPDVIAFLKLHPGEALSDKAPPVDGPFMTLRSVTLCNRAVVAYSKMKGAEGKLVADDATYEIARGYMGEEAAVKFIAHLKYGAEIPQPETVAKSPEKAPLPKRELQMMAAATYAAHATKQTVGKFMQYLGRDGVMEEAALSFVTIIEQRDPIMVANREVSNWIRANQRARAAARSD